MSTVAKAKCLSYDVPAMQTVGSFPDVMGGTLVFTGTRVPLETLLDYLEAGDSINEFLGDFPTVSREQVIATLETMKASLADAARR